MAKSFLKRRFWLAENDRGQSLVEMALVCVVFFFLLFGILEFSRALWTYNTIVQNTRAAARWAVVNVLDNSETADIAKTKNIVVYGYPDVSSGTPLVPGLSPSLVNVSVETLEADTSTPPKPISQKISVSVSGYQFQFLIPIAPALTIPAFETSLYTESKGEI
jgi:Flp pilus assembly protein TadG